MIDNGLDLGNLTFAFEIDTKRLITALVSEDDIGEAERAVIHALKVMDESLPVKKRGTQMYLMQKLERLEGLGVPLHFLKPLRTLSSHRNSFAHRAQDVIAEKQASELAEAVRAILPSRNDQSRLTVHGKRAFDKTYGEATTKERYVMSASAGLMFVGAFPEIAKVAAAKA